LASQVFVIDGETRVGDYVKKFGDELGTPVKLTAFARFELGQGVEKGPEEDFAAEVAATLGNA
jgi:elongation factor Ts